MVSASLWGAALWVPVGGSKIVSQWWDSHPDLLFGPGWAHWLTGEEGRGSSQPQQATGKPQRGLSSRQCLRGVQGRATRLGQPYAQPPLHLELLQACGGAHCLLLKLPQLLSASPGALWGVRGVGAWAAGNFSSFFKGDPGSGSRQLGREHAQLSAHWTLRLDLQLDNRPRQPWVGRPCPASALPFPCPCPSPPLPLPCPSCPSPAPAPTLPPWPASASPSGLVSGVRCSSSTSLTPLTLRGCELTPIHTPSWDPPAHRQTGAREGQAGCRGMADQWTWPYVALATASQYSHGPQPVGLHINHSSLLCVTDTSLKLKNDFTHTQQEAG